MADAKSNVQSATLLENAHKRAAMVTKPDLASSREVRLALMTKYTRPKFDLPSRHGGIIDYRLSQKRLG